MVQKLQCVHRYTERVFESSVVLDGTKTLSRYSARCNRFESSVVLDGTKTRVYVGLSSIPFESSVVLDGTKTYSKYTRYGYCLRVVLF